MASVDGVAALTGVPDQTQLQQQQQQQQQPPRVVERLNPAVQQQLNLESVKTRAISLFKAISRILEDFDAIARTNAVPKWLALVPYSVHLLSLLTVIISKLLGVVSRC